ncbi:MAG: pilus assembly FimT family protein [Candidatus Xenobia bacterium]
MTRTRGASAFTLIEIIVSMAIIAIVLAVAIPYFIHGDAARDQDGARKQIQALFNYARQGAQSAGGSVNLTLQAANPINATVNQTTVPASLTPKSFLAPPSISISVFDASNNKVTSYPLTFTYGSNGSITLVNSSAPAANTATHQTVYTVTVSAPGQTDLSMIVDATTGNTVLK